MKPSKMYDNLLDVYYQSYDMPKKRLCSLHEIKPFFHENSKFFFFNSIIRTRGSKLFFLKFWRVGSDLYISLCGRNTNNFWFRAITFICVQYLIYLIKCGEFRPGYHHVIITRGSEIFFSARRLVSFGFIWRHQSRSFSCELQVRMLEYASVSYYERQKVFPSSDQRLQYYDHSSEGILNFFFNSCEQLENVRLFCHELVQVIGSRNNILCENTFVMRCELYANMHTVCGDFLCLFAAFFRVLRKYLQSGPYFVLVHFQVNGQAGVSFVRNILHMCFTLFGNTYLRVNFENCFFFIKSS